MIRLGAGGRVTEERAPIGADPGEAPGVHSTVRRVQGDAAGTPGERDEPLAQRHTG